jgi:hypothetical protein
MISLLIYFLVAVILLSVAIWATSLIPDAQIQKVARIVIVVIAAIVLCYFLLNFAGSGPDLGYHHRL